MTVNNPFHWSLMMTTLNAGSRVLYSRNKQFGYGTLVTDRFGLRLQPDNDPNTYPLKRSRKFLATAAVGTSNGRTVPGYQILSIVVDEPTAPKPTYIITDGYDARLPDTTIYTEKRFAQRVLHSIALDNAMEQQLVVGTLEHHEFVVAFLDKHYVTEYVEAPEPEFIHTTRELFVKNIGPAPTHEETMTSLLASMGFTG